MKNKVLLFSWLFLFSCHVLAQGSSSGIPSIPIDWVTTTEERIKNLENEINQSIKIPVGTIVAYWKDDAPEGWLLCDGSSIPAVFKELRKIVGKNKNGPYTTPDLRGLFLRGANMGRKDGKGETEKYIDRRFGDYQSDGVGKHNHTAYHGARGGGSLQNHAPNSGGEKVKIGLPTSEDGIAETRPRNVSVTWIIKH
uniref:Phage Tail Collar Domain n=1 Tax=Candidatus Kentrum sp. LFY TaxID=2126342 RepID=A0A450UEE5_9GAMM|nr:MAG: Phage Tail Collar Domain [Candidatus Kentron sp. LFY]